MKTKAKTLGDCFVSWGLRKCGGKGGKPEARVNLAWKPPAGSIYEGIPNVGNNKSVHDTEYANDLVGRLNTYERAWIEHEDKNPQANESTLHAVAMEQAGLMGDGLTAARGYANKAPSSKPGIHMPVGYQPGAVEPEHVRVAKKISALVAEQFGRNGFGVIPLEFRGKYSDMSDEDKKGVVKELKARGLIPPIMARARKLPLANDLVNGILEAFKGHYEKHRADPLNRHIHFTESDAFKKAIG